MLDASCILVHVLCAKPVKLNSHRSKCWMDAYLSLLNRSLSASNMCLMLRFRAWAVYQSCSFWKLGSCVSPMMMSGGSCCAPLCSTRLAECGRAGHRQSFLKGVQAGSAFAPPTRETPYPGLVSVTPPHGGTVLAGGAASVLLQAGGVKFNVLL